MKNTKKLTLSSVLSALGVVLMAFGSVIDLFDLTICAVASLIVVFVYLEIGTAYAFGVYLATSLLSLILLPSKIVFFEYFFVFGIYPLLKALIERLPRWSWLLVKILYINAVVWLLLLFSELFLGVPFIEGDTLIIKVLVYLLLNVTFIVYDYFITVMVRVYVDKFRKQFKKFIK